MMIPFCPSCGLSHDMTLKKNGQGDYDAFCHNTHHGLEFGKEAHDMIARKTPEQRLQDVLAENKAIEREQLAQQQAIAALVKPVTANEMRREIAERRNAAPVVMPTEVVTNAAGAKQCATAYRVDLLPPLATLAVGAVLQEGAEKYGEENWRGIPVKENINHALIHLFAYLGGDKQEPHLDHAACRILFALELSKC